MESKKVEFFNRLSFITILATLFLSLFFFIPYVPVTLDASKGFLISIGMTLALFFWLISRLGEGKFLIPRDKIIIFAALIPLSFLVSSFFSSSQYISFFGSGFEVGTFGSMLVLFILFFLSSIYFQTEKRLWYFCRAFTIAAVILAIFEIINIFFGFGRFLPGILKGISAGNLVGTWNDFALFFGLAVILATLTLEFLKVKGIFRVMQYFILVSGLLFLVIINMHIAWILVGAFSVVIFIYSISIQQALVKNTDEDNMHKKKFPLTALIVVLVCLFFLIGNNSVGQLISRYVSLPNTDVRPLVSTTSQIALKAIKHNPFFGTGPNTFGLDWALWQPKGVAQSVYWNVDFTNGFSSLMTFAVTTGILGLVALLLFIITFFLRGITSLGQILHNRLSDYFTMMALITALYSWITIIFYTPSIIMFMLAFASSGMLIGILVYHKRIEVRTFSFLSDPRNSFFAILGLMVLMIVTLSTTYIYTEKFASIFYFSKGLNSTNTIESLSESQRMISNALLLDQNDIYYRALSQVYVAEIGILLNNKSLSADTLKSNIQQLVNLAEQSAGQAVSQNPKQYINYVNLGNVYAALVPLNVTNSYENAVTAYNKAREFAPNNPSIPLALASLEISHKNNDEARKYIDQAVKLKTDYTDAIFLLAQIETNEGNLGAAIKQAERAAILTPQDPTVFFRLGLLRYNNNDYSGAVSAFEQAVILDPNYLNARFLLGEAYHKVGRNDDALTQFKILNKILPDNQDVKDALSSLKAPVSTQAPATDTTGAKAPVKPAKAPLSGQH